MKKVNEVSRLAGVSKRTLQFYDDEGLLPAQRSKDNYRLYDDAALERLWEILVYRAMGLDLKEIKYLLTLSEKQQKQYLEKKIRGLRQQIRQLNGQMEFISYVQQNGMLPVPTEENTVEKTYMDHIAVLRKMKQDQKREDKEVIEQGLEQKLDAMLRHELYAQYKTAPTEEQREQARQEYLDRRGVPESFRW